MKLRPGDPERLELLHKVCKGDGLAALDVSDRGHDVSTFGVADSVSFAKLVRSSVQLMSDSRPKFAVQAALGIELPELKLTERRKKLAELLEVSPRTLARDEEAGLRLLDVLIDRELEQRPWEYERSSVQISTSTRQKALVRELRTLARDLPQAERIALLAKLTEAVFGPGK